MVVFLNGRFVAENAARVSVFDRGFLYGDGLFETLRIVRGRPFEWDAHMERFTRGAEFLKLRPPLTSVEMQHAVGRLVTLNALPDSVLRLTLTRGAGPRGYSPQGADSPALVMALHRLPARKPGGLRLVTSSFHVTADDPLAQIKTCSKLLHVLARAEAEAQRADDAMLINTRGEIAETTSSNIFWISGDALATPPKRCGALEGVTRAKVLEMSHKLGLSCGEIAAEPSTLRSADGVFLTNSVQGIVEAVALDGKELRRSPYTARWIETYRRLRNSEMD
jgi:branched-chain amino acid aminotransferase